MERWRAFLVQRVWKRLCQWHNIWTPGILKLYQSPKRRFHHNINCWIHIDSTVTMTDDTSWSWWRHMDSPPYGMNITCVYNIDARAETICIDWSISAGSLFRSHKIRYSYGRNKESSALIVSGMSIQVVGSALMVGRPVCWRTDDRPIVWISWFLLPVRQSQ